MSQDLLDESEIETLVNLLLRSQQSRAREALCLRIGIDPKRLWFLKDSSDSDFVTQLLDHLNEIGDREALCKLCCEELFPIFKKGTSSPILREIAVKLNCHQELQHNSFNNIKAKQPFSPPSSPAPEFSVNFPNQPDISKSQSLFTRIADHKNKLLAAAVILAFGLVVYPAYEHLKQPPQLAEDIALTQNAPLVRAETKGKISEYREGIIPIKRTGVNLRNFTIEAQFRNPYDGAMDNWTYGFAFHENTSARKSFDVWVTSKEKEWRFGTTAKSSNDNLPNLDVAENGSNKLRLTVNKNKATFFVNDSYIATFDVSDFTNKGDVLLIAKDGISGKSVQYENLKVWSLDN